MISFSSTGSKRLLARSLRSRIALILCGILFLALGTNAAFADMNSAVDKLMGDAILQSQKMVSLMTQSCPGGAHGQNPNHYDEFVKFSNEVGTTLGDLRVQLAKGQVAN